MGLENVREEILVQVRQQAAQKAELAHQEARRMEQAAKQEIASFRKEAEKHHFSLAQATERKILAAARFEAQRMIMNAKQDILKDVLAQARQALQQLPKLQRQEFLQRLLKQAQQDISVAEVLVREEDQGLISGVVVKQGNISGGLRATTKDRTISVDYSLDELLEQSRSRLLIQLSEVLFGKQ